MPYKRIMIFGLSGAGKSTFSVELAERLSLPLYHLDSFYFAENWKVRPREEFLDLHSNLIQREEWIIDGNGLSSLEGRYARADLALYFCAPRPLCFLRLIKRRLFKDPSIRDRAEGCRERLPYHLIKYMWGFEKKISPLIPRLQEIYPHVPFYRIQKRKDLEAVYFPPK